MKEVCENTEDRKTSKMTEQRKALQRACWVFQIKYFTPSSLADLNSSIMLFTSTHMCGLGGKVCF